MATIDEISNAFYLFSQERYEKELKTADKSKDSFPSKNEFLEDFQLKINAIYSDLNKTYPPAQAKYVYETLIANLNKQSQNPAQSKIVDLSKGKINVQNLKAYSKKVQETLKTRHPERFEVKETSVESKTPINETKKEIDFSNPEEKKTYFDNLYKGLSNCKTKQEKKIYIQENFGISLENMTEKQQDQAISRLEKRGKIIEIRNTLNEENLRKENPDLDDEEIKKLLENTAAEQYALENDRNVETEINDNNEMIELENIESEILKLKQELNKNTDESKKEKINNKLTFFKEQKSSLVNKVALSKEEDEKLSENVKEHKKQENSIEQNNQHMNEMNRNTEYADLFSDIPYETAEDLSDLLDAPIDDVEPKKEVPEQPILADKKVFINPILTGADENDLKQEDYTMEIEEKNGLWNRIKKGISKIKDFISEKIGLTQNKQLKGQAYLDTAENNTKSVHEYTEMKNTFDESLQVSKEDQEKYKKEYQATKKVPKQSSVLEVNKNTGQSVEF